MFQLPKEGGPQPDYYREAVLLPYNWIALVAGAAFSLIALSPYPLMATIGAELMYLSVVPSNPRFQRWMRARFQLFEWRRNQLQLIKQVEKMPPAVRKRYFQLQRMCVDIRENHNQLSSTSRVLVEQIENNLAGLLRSYLGLTSKAYQYHVDLSESSEREIAQEVDTLQDSLKSATGNEIRNINMKRLETLKERLNRRLKMMEDAKIIDAQCTAIEDVIRLMKDQSMTLQDPFQIMDRLGFLLEDAERIERYVTQAEASISLGPEING